MAIDTNTMLSTRTTLSHQMDSTLAAAGKRSYALPQKQLSRLLRPVDADAWFVDADKGSIITGDPDIHVINLSAATRCLLMVGIGNSNETIIWSDRVIAESYNANDPATSAEGITRLFDGKVDDNNNGITSFSGDTKFSGFNKTGSKVSLLLTGNTPSGHGKHSNGCSDNCIWPSKWIHWRVRH